MSGSEGPSLETRLAVAESRIKDLNARVHEVEELLHRDTVADRVTRLEVLLTEFREKYDTSTAEAKAMLSAFSQTNTAIRLIQPIVTSVVTAVVVAAVMYLMGLSPSP